MATWQLDPTTTHLNHGSFGATPVEVLDHQQELRSCMETNPVDFMMRQYQPLLEQSRTAVAEFVGADADGLVFVPNATYGVNSVLRSLETELAPGSDIVITNHTYNACRNAAAETARRIGGQLIVADIPFPIDGPETVVDAVRSAVTPSTGLVLIDHVTSATALILPVREIIAALDPNVLVLIDGAHAPGMIDVDVASLGASFYTANCHKWMCAPKGAAFLWVAASYRDTIGAVAVSHGYNDGWPQSSSRFHAQFDWTGTDDPTARLSVPQALSVMGEHHRDGWAGIRDSNHAMVMQGRDILATALGATPPAPEEMIGSIAAIAIPEDRYPGVNALGVVESLHQQSSIEVPVSPWPSDQDRLLRMSAQQYNTLADYERLALAFA